MVPSDSSIVYRAEVNDNINNLVFVAGVVDSLFEWIHGLHDAISCTVFDAIQ
jgi:hypothetical protein